jgi:putative nucleotidyltransferase with HDIG domain
MYENLIAQFDFPILKTDVQIQEEMEKAWQSVIPYYRLNKSVSAQAEKNLLSADLGKYSSLKPELAASLKSIYDRGVISPRSLEYANELNSELLYIQKDNRANKVPLSEIYTVEEAADVFRNAVAQLCVNADVDSLYRAAALAELIQADLIFDEQTTDLVHDEVINYISVTQGVGRSGQTIVSEGEIVTAEIAQLLDSYKEEFNRSIGTDAPSAYRIISTILLAFSLVLVLFLAIYYCNSRIFDQYNKYLYLLMVFALSAVASSVISRIGQEYFYMVPFTLIALYLLAFFKKRVVFTVYVISLLPLLIFAREGVELFVMYLVAGVVGMLVFSIFNRGWLQFVTALIVFVVMILVWGAFNLTEGFGALIDYAIVLLMAFGALLSVAAYPLIYLFEKIFNLVSNTRLVELSDTSNKLLRLLADKAPGTFQHSLQVMNLADAVARAIGANVLLVRAGALYHDVGKIANPQCFTENQNPGVRYHEGLSPKESAQEIIRHVSDGLALAEKYRLPSIVREFISTHHGTTCTMYFYNKHLLEGGSESERSEFCYDGTRPKTKEQVVLMMCDAVEAASRSLKDYSAESVSELVERIINGKIEDGQLSESEISMSELSVAKEVIKSYIQQMYHARVAYPKRLAKGAK